MKAILLAALLVACGGDGVNAPTRGEGVAAIGEAFCNRLVSCELLPEEEAGYCYAHNQFHLCELEGTCDDKISEERYLGMMACAESLEVAECFYLSYGFLPEPCHDAF